ncbi:hypothetical protein HHI36_012282 [Cryptolaemus montrouzieri]|uniref:PHD-type domain-containing protein n=1 Tax=Cryptolaemus montrouzieri TaxID=559131 RepID=A0ABD2NE84_9CUCU
MSLKPTGRSGDGITSNFKYKCLMCPNKGFIGIEEAKQCKKCLKFFHNSCAERSVLNQDGSYVFCCGAFVDDHTLPNTPSNGGDPSSPADDATNEADLGKKYLPLWNLMKRSLSVITTKLDMMGNDVESKLAGVNSRLDNNESKISEMADRVTLLENCGGSHYVTVKHSSMN